MTELLRLILAFLLPLLTGIGIACALDKKSRLNFAERISIGFILGSGLLSIYMFCIGMAGLKFTALALCPYFIAGGALLFIYRSKLFFIQPRVDKDSGNKTNIAKAVVYAAILALTAWKLFFILYYTFEYKTFFNDALSVWNYKAKAIYYASALRGSEASEIFGGTGAGYPLSLPLFRAWIAIMTGTWHDAYVNLYNTVLLAFTVLFFHSSLRRLTNFFTATVFSYIFISLPLIPYHAFGGYADLPVACYLFTTVILLARWFTENGAQGLYLPALLAAVLMFTKNEGIIVCAPLLAAIFASYVILSPAYPKRTKLRLLAGLFAAIAVAAVPWLTGKLISGSSAGFSLEFHSDAFPEIFSVLFKETSFHTLWLSVLLIPLLKPSGLKDKTFLAHALPALTFLAAALAIFVISSNYEWLYQRTTINRTLLIAAPLIIFSLGIFIGRNILGKSEEKTGKE